MGIARKGTKRVVVLALVMGGVGATAGKGAEAAVGDAPSRARALQQEVLTLSLPGGWIAILRSDGEGIRVDGMHATAGGTGPVVDVEAGDLVVAFEGVEEPSMAALRDLLTAATVGDTVTLVLLRGPDRVTVRYPHQELAMMRGAVGSSSAAAGAPTGLSFTEEAPSDERLAGLLSEVEVRGPGVTFAVSVDDELATVGAKGMADVEHGVPMTPETVLPAASVSKMITGFVVASLVEEGALSPSDPVRSHLPELTRLPMEVSVGHLLHHTSGIKDYTGLLAFSGWRFGDSVSDEELMALLSRQEELHFEPGARHQYSNSNYFLLARIAERVAGEPFPDLLTERAFSRSPLTGITTDPAGAARAVATRYRSTEGGRARVRATHEVLGPGGVYTSASALADWGASVMSGDVGGGEILTLMSTEGRLGDGTGIGYGAGVGLDRFRGTERLSHSGSVPGGQAVLHLYPEHRLAVAVLANTEEPSVYEIAEALASLHLPEAPPAVLTGGAGGAGGGMMMLTDEDIAGESVPLLDPSHGRFAGRFSMSEGGEWATEFSEGRLTLVLAPGAPGVPLVGRLDGSFFFPPGRWVIEFREDGEGHVTGLVVHLGEDSVRRGEPRDIVGTRVAAEPLTAAGRAALVGRYVSDELGLVYRIGQDDAGLWVEHARLGRLRLHHDNGDVFTIPGSRLSQLTVDRGEGGEVTGVVIHAYAWGATARFERRD